MLVDEYNESYGTLEGADCELCRNKGVIQHLVNGDIVNRQCVCSIQRSSLKKLEKSGLSELIKEYTFSTFKTTDEWQKKAKKNAIDFTKASEGWFFIGGQSGAGKTHLCTAICGQFLKKNKSVRYMLWTTEIRNLKAVVNDDVVYNKLLNEFANTDILYIDDLFKKAKNALPTLSDIDRTFEIINQRYYKKLITIISSEKSINDLIDIDTAIGSRIYQRAKGFTVELGHDEDKNWRLK